MKAVILRCLVALLLCGASTASMAHRFHAGITDIAFNHKTGNVEIVHTFMAHDIDALLAARQKRQPALAEAGDETNLRQYIEERFYLLGQDKAKLPLKWVGFSANVESVVIYQELENAPLSRIARVHDEVLTDVLPRQANTVNIKQDGSIRSLSFDRKNTERPLK